MDIERPLLWQQGMFLQPQHFQLLERSCQALFAPLPEYLAPHMWGVGQAEIQRSALSSGSFRLTRGSFLFPDGSHALLPGNAFAESRAFSADWVEGGRTFPVFLGLKRWNAEGKNVTMTEAFDNLSGVTTRFISQLEPEGCADLHAGGPQSEVQRLSYVLRIFWESELDQVGDYLIIPLAQLERSGDEINLSKRYVPPSLTVSSSEILAGIVKEVRDQMASRGRRLEGYKRERGIQSADFGSKDMVFLLALRSLNRYLPLLFHVTETRQVHPWAAYGLLRQIVGELSTFHETITSLGETAENEERLPPYDHRALGECFQAAQHLIATLLNSITDEPDYVIKLVYDGTYFSAEMKSAYLQGDNRFYLVLRTRQEASEVLTSVSTVAKLSTRERLPILMARALQGITLEHLPVVPRELPRRPGAVYFAIDSRHEQWALVEKGRNLALYWDAAPQDLEVELMVVGRR